MSRTVLCRPDLVCLPVRRALEREAGPVAGHDVLLGRLAACELEVGVAGPAALAVAHGLASEVGNGFLVVCVHLCSGSGQNKHNWTSGRASHSQTIRSAANHF